jgi:hypothetical protein
MYQLTDGTIIRRMSDGAFIPADHTNTDYQQYLVWLAGGGVPLPAQPTTPVVPQQITRAQGKAALITMGVWGSVTAYVATITDPTERALAEVALNDTLTWKRSSPFLNTAAAALGLTPAQIDALFVAAAAIEL